MGRSTEFYRKNPKARKKKNAWTKKINKRPDQMAKRRELGKANYAHDKKHGKAKRRGKDLAHTKNGLRYKDSSKNRGSRSDTQGDRNARG